MFKAIWTTHTFPHVFFRRTFPHCKINLTGLIPCAKYILLVDMVPEDGFRYKVRKHWFIIQYSERKKNIPLTFLYHTIGKKWKPVKMNHVIGKGFPWMVSAIHRQDATPSPLYHPPSPDIGHQRVLSLPVFLSPAGSPLYYPLFSVGGTGPAINPLSPLYPPLALWEATIAPPVNHLCMTDEPHRDWFWLISSPSSGIKRNGRWQEKPSPSRPAGRSSTRNLRPPGATGWSSPSPSSSSSSPTTPWTNTAM